MQWIGRLVNCTYWQIPCILLFTHSHSLTPKKYPLQCIFPILKAALKISQCTYFVMWPEWQHELSSLTSNACDPGHCPNGDRKVLRGLVEWGWKVRITGQALKMNRFYGNTQRSIMGTRPLMKPQLFALNLEENDLIITPIIKWCGLFDFRLLCCMHNMCRFVWERQMWFYRWTYAFSMHFNTSNIGGMW